MGWKRKRLASLGDEDLHDVHLVGTDGEAVPCCKAYLAGISPVFKSMFFRGFKEQKSGRCSLDFHSVVISMIVKYCYCGEVDMDLIFSKNRSLEEEASLLVGLREAGRYFEIDELSSTSDEKIGNLVFQLNNDKRKYHYASALLTELFKRDEDKKSALWLALCGFAGKFTMECFGPRAPENDSTDTFHVHPNVLSNALKQTQDTYVAVMCIQQWLLLENKSTENGYSDEDKCDLIEIAQNLDLKRLSTSQLSNIQPSSVFSSERILEAFVHHCKRDANFTAATTKAATNCSYRIFGAGMEHLNGVYRRLWHDSEIFFKRVKHNGILCYSLIHPRRKECKWLISITLDLGASSFNDGIGSEIRETDKIHVYESCSMSTESTKVPPITGWRSIKEGTGPDPMVTWDF